METVSQINPVDQFHGPMPDFPIRKMLHGVGEGQHDVLQRAGAGQQIKILEHEANLVVAQQRPFIGGQAGYLPPVQPVLSRCCSSPP